MLQRREIILLAVVAVAVVAAAYYMYKKPSSLFFQGAAAWKSCGDFASWIRANPSAYLADLGFVAFNTGEAKVVLNGVQVAVVDVQPRGEGTLWGGDQRILSAGCASTDPDSPAVATIQNVANGARLDVTITSKHP